MKQYQFSLKHECMKELPSMEEPVIGDYSVSFGKEHQIDIEVYKKHLASLQSIPAPKEFLSSFIDGKIYNEDEFTVGFDCAVYSLGCCSGGNELCNKCHIAIPKQKVDNTDCIEIATDLYKEMQDININSSKWQSILMEYSLLISKLQKHYTITRKNNQ